MEDVQKFVGKWKMDRSENMDQFFQAVGMNYFIRKMAGAAKPEQDVKLEDDTLKISIHTAFMTREDFIKVNAEYEKHDEKMGIKFKCKSRVEDGKLIVDQEAIDGGSNVKPQTVCREIVGDETLVTITIGDIVSRRWFKRLQ